MRCVRRSRSKICLDAFAKDRLLLIKQQQQPSTYDFNRSTAEGRAVSPAEIEEEIFAPSLSPPCQQVVRTRERLPQLESRATPGIAKLPEIFRDG